MSLLSAKLQGIENVRALSTLIHLLKNILKIRMSQKCFMNSKGMLSLYSEVYVRANCCRCCCRSDKGAVEVPGVNLPLVCVCIEKLFLTSLTTPEMEPSGEGLETIILHVSLSSLSHHQVNACSHETFTSVIIFSLFKEKKIMKSI